MFYFLVLTPNLIWPFIAKAIWPHRLTTLEILLQVGFVLLVGWSTYNLSTYWQAQDVEVLNGEVSSKKSQHVSCGHSYRCNPHRVRRCSGSGKSKSCRYVTEYDTCYEHPWDQDWVVHTNLLDSYTFSRVDRRGLQEPPRWTEVKIGDPASKTQSYQNLVLAASNSLYNTTEFAKYLETYKGALPEYNSNIHSYYKHDKLTTVGVKLTKEERDNWNLQLGNAAKKIGPIYHANPIVVLVGKHGAEYANALQAKWLGGKLNDVVLVIGTDDGRSIKWARGFSWSEKSMVDVALRDRILELPGLTPEGVSKALIEVVPKAFSKRSKKSFDYLKDEIQPSTTTLIWTFVLCLFFNVSLTVLFYKFETLPSLRDVFPQLRRRV